MEQGNIIMIFKDEMDSLSPGVQMMPSTSREACYPLLTMMLKQDVLHKASKEKMIDEHQTDLKISDVRSVKLEAESTEVQHDTTEDPDSPKYVCGYCGLMFCLQDDYMHHLNVQHGCDITQATLELLDSKLAQGDSSINNVPTQIEENDYKTLPVTVNSKDCNILEGQSVIKAKLNKLAQGDSSINNVPTKIEENTSKTFPLMIDSNDRNIGEFEPVTNARLNISTQEGTNQYKCDVCGKGFIDSKKHRCRVKHAKADTGEKPCKCNVCGKAFTQANDLGQHKRTHRRGEKPYKCDVCVKGFSGRRLSSLQVHSRTHTGDYPYKCDVCEKSFSHSNDVKIHMRTHTTEKPYKCDVCGTAFANVGNLHIHMRIIHTGEKPYKCDVCGKPFTLANDLATHKRTHTGERPYKCDVCGKCFRQSSHLYTHSRTHTGENP